MDQFQNIRQLLISKGYDDENARRELQQQMNSGNAAINCHMEKPNGKDLVHYDIEVKLLAPDVYVLGSVKAINYPGGQIEN